MKLVELQPEWLTYVVAEDGRCALHHVASLGEAQGIWFLCPECYVRNGMSDVGTHWVMVSFEGRGVPDAYGSRGRDGSPTRWAVSGGGFADLTLAPSILISGSCEAHFFVREGAIV